MFTLPIVPYFCSLLYWVCNLFFGNSALAVSLPRVARLRCVYVACLGALRLRTRLCLVCGLCWVLVDRAACACVDRVVTVLRALRVLSACDVRALRACCDHVECLQRLRRACYACFARALTACGVCVLGALRLCTRLRLVCACVECAVCLRCAL
jgi:hypothetical protein